MSSNNTLLRKKNPIRFYDHIAQYIPTFATVKASTTTRRKPTSKTGQLVSLTHKINDDKRDDDDYALYDSDELPSASNTPRSLSSMKFGLKSGPVVVQPLPKQSSREKFHLTIDLRFATLNTDTDSSSALSPKMAENIPDATSFDRMVNSRLSSSMSSARSSTILSARSEFMSAEMSPNHSGRDPDSHRLNDQVIEFDKDDLPYIPPIATNLTKLLATIPDSAPASLSPFTFCAEVTKLEPQDFEQYLEEDTLCLKSVLFGNRFDKDSFKDFFLQLDDEHYAIALDVIFRQYFKLSQIANLIPELMKCDSIPSLAYQIEQQCESLFGVKTAMLWVNIPSAKQLINHSRSMKYPHGVGFIGTAASERRQVIAPNPMTSPIFSEEYDYPFCEEAEMILAEPITNPKTNELYGVLMMIDKVHHSGLSYTYWPQSELTQLHFLSSNLYRVFSRFTKSMQNTGHLLKVIAKFVSHQLDFFRLLSTVKSSITSLLKCEEVSIYFREERNVFWFENVGNKIQRKSSSLSKSGIARYVFEAKAFVHVPCARDHPAFDSTIDGKYASRSALAIPLHAGDSVFAVIVCRAKKSLPLFTSSDVHVLSIVSAGAAPALQSSMAYRKKMNELKVAWRAQDRLAALLQTAESLSRETNIDILVGRILKNSCDLIGADRASLFVIDESRTHLISKVAHGTTKPLLLPINQGIAGSVAMKGEVVNIPDVYDDPRFNSNVDKSTGYHTKSLMTLPVHDQNGKTIAVMQLMNKLNGEPFSDSDVELTRAMCVFTGIALANSSVIDSSISSTKRVQALLDTVLLLMRGESLSSVLHHIMNISRDLVQADRCALFMVDDKKSSMRSAVLAGEENQISVKKGKGIVGYVALKKVVVNIDDAYKDKRFNSAVDQATGYRTRSILAAPVLNSNNRIIGVVEMINKDMLYNGGSFTKEDEKLTTVFASFAGLAFDKTKATKHSSVSIMTGQTLAIVLSNMMTADESNSSLPPAQIVMPPAQLAEYRTNRFNMLQFSELQALRLLASFFYDLGLISHFKINNAKFIRFLLAVHDLYQKQTIHGWRQAIESTQFVYYLLSSTELIDALSKLEMLALLISALCHDIDHYDIEDKGRSEIALAVLYRNRPILEMHHCEVTISVISKEEQNIFENIENDQSVQLWQMIISLILATDMAQHFEILNKFKALVYPQNMLNLANSQHKLLLMQIILKCSDVAHSCRLMTIDEDFAKKVGKLYYDIDFDDENDGEKITQNVKIAKNMVGFTLIFSRPLFLVLAEAVPGARSAFDQLEGNLEEWKKRAKG